MQDEIEKSINEIFDGKASISAFSYNGSENSKVYKIVTSDYSTEQLSKLKKIGCWLNINSKKDIKELELIYILPITKEES